MIGLTVEAGDHFKKRAAIPLAPCRSVEKAMREERVVERRK
jgi:hypothetical protein